MFLTLFVVSACSSPSRTADQSTNEARMLAIDTQTAIDRFKAQDPSMIRFFDTAHGYVVFPSVGKGGAVVGGAHGDGQVFESGKLVGTATLSQFTLGLQLGGQEYREVIFLNNKGAFDNFTSGEFEFSGQASAVAAEAGAAEGADYSPNGVAVFLMPIAGLMAEASIGGQKFEYAPVR